MTQTPEHIVILTDFAQARGGASALARMQAELLVQRGFRVTMIAGDDSTASPPGAGLVSIGGRKLLEQGKVSAALTGLWNARARKLLARWVTQNDSPATIYHVHGMQQTLSPSVLAPLQSVARRVVLHAHDYFLACANGAFFDFPARAACQRDPRSLSCLLRNCDKRSYAQKLWRLSRQGLQNRQTATLLREGRVVLIHPAMGRRLWPGQRGIRSVTIPNPVAPMAAGGTDPAAQAGFLYVGDIHAYKGVFLLAEAARQAGVALRFVGDGQDRGALQARYPEHGFDGWVDRAGLASRLAQARALIAPTLGPEPYGLAPVEALLSGVPVLLSDSMLLAEDIRHHGAGAVFAAGDAGDLARQLARLAGDDAAVRAMAAQAAATAARLSLSPDVWAERLLALYAEMLAQGHKDAPRVTAGQKVRAAPSQP